MKQRVVATTALLSMLASGPAAGNIPKIHTIPKNPPVTGGSNPVPQAPLPKVETEVDRIRKLLSTESEELPVVIQALSRLIGTGTAKQIEGGLHAAKYDIENGKSEKFDINMSLQPALQVTSNYEGTTFAPGGTLLSRAAQRLGYIDGTEETDDKNAEAVRVISLLLAKGANPKIVDILAADAGSDTPYAFSSPANNIIVTRNAAALEAITNPALGDRQYIPNAEVISYLHEPVRFTDEATPKIRQDYESNTKQCLDILKERFPKIFEQGKKLFERKYQNEDRTPRLA